ncbi:MAG: DUF2812 domain-containing protein [Peptoniphilaceae bacterium]|nr:DUF2812 domain-containing protein [Peptoniphilaceae bacterium]MDY5832975.1 DUF2812 domain-containing protein [Candidatus Onthovivens sp.]
MKTFLRIFFNPIEDRERFLNKKAEEGYELVSSGSVFHKFNKTDKNKKYMVHYIGYMNNKERMEYEDFIKNMNMRILYSPLNLGKKSYGNVKYRPYNPIKSSLATNPGMINREIMIVENSNGKKIEMYTDSNSKIRDLSRRKKPYTYLFLASVIIIFIGVLEKLDFNIRLFNQTFLSFRPFDNIINVWITLGILILIYSIAKLIQLNNMIKFIDSNII